MQTAHTHSSFFIRLSFVMAARIFGALALSALASAAPIPGSLSGIFRQPTGSCVIINIDLNTGKNSTGAAVHACDAITATWPAYSVLNVEEGRLELAISSASSIVSIDLKNGAEKSLADLPAENANDPFLGLVRAQNVTYLVLSSAVYAVLGGKLNKVATVALPLMAATAIAPSDGTGGAPVIYVADEGSATVYAIDLGASPPSTRTFVSSVNGPWDLQYSAVTGTLLELGAYQFYSVDTTSGKTTKIINIPNGPGYPRVNGISDDGSNFFYFDFAQVHVVDVAAAKITANVPFTWASKAVGFPVWIPA